MKRILSLFIVLLCGATLWAQEKKADYPPMSAYRVDIALIESDSGKKINTRQFSIMMTDSRVLPPPPNASATSSLNTNLRLPYAGEKGPQYMDIGFDFNCRMTLLSDGRVYFEADGQLSSMTTENASQGGPPPLQRNRFSAATIPTFGKPFTIASVDQLGSNRRYEFQVTVTKL